MPATTSLPALGWDEWFESNMDALGEPELLPGRVGTENRGSYLVYTESGDVWAELSGKFRYGIRRRSELPAVGDWVALRRRRTEDPALVVAVLPRRTKFSRKESGDRHDLSSDRFTKTEEQVLAANLDFLLLVCALTDEFNIRRIERYLTMAWEGGSTPVVVLNKADLRDPSAAREAIVGGAPGVEVCVTSALSGEGLVELGSYASPGKTVAFVGSSGVGKTTLVNALTRSRERKVAATRRDDRGRHATTKRELVPLPQGGFIIDTPGLRELQLWNSTEGIDRVFEELTALAGECRFRNCAHLGEPDCAIRRALEDGRLDAGRYKSYQKLRAELAYLESKQDRRIVAAERKKSKEFTKAARMRSRGR